ncbi:hypothetical protein NCS52_00736600 [Fusarium sp. LHS14.1]|nr:hypothetical protein NCS52_00736600 [Fusarium sp. LHS14.1]
MEESNPPNVNSDSAPTQLPSSIVIRIQIDGATVRIDHEPSASSQLDGTTHLATNSTQNSARERSTTVETLEISEMREKLRNSEDHNRALQQELERFKADHAAFGSMTEKIHNLKQEDDSLKKQVDERKEELEKLNNAVGSNLEARFYKCQYEIANSQVQSQDEMAIELRAARKDIDGLNAHIERLNEEHGECGFEPLEPSHATLKRKAVESLYRDGTLDVKKIRLAEDIHLDLEGLRPVEACDLIGKVNNEVLRVAARACLVNFQHLNTGPNGTLGLTQFGLKKAATTEGFRSYLEAVEHGEEKSAELTAKARDLMSKSGFLLQGHQSLLPLKDLLKGREVAPANLVQCI